MVRVSLILAMTLLTAACEDKPATGNTAAPASARAAAPFFCRTTNKYDVGGPRECFTNRDRCESSEHQCFERVEVQCFEQDGLYKGRQVTCTPTTEECAAWVKANDHRRPSVCRQSRTDEVPAKSVVQ